MRDPHAVDTLHDSEPGTAVELRLVDPNDCRSRRSVMVEVVSSDGDEEDEEDETDEDEGEAEDDGDEDEGGLPGWLL